MSKSPFLSLDHIQKSFTDPDTGVNRTVLHDVSLEISAGESYALIGESGCGKTTLTRIITGLLTADSGTVTLDGKPLRFNSAEDRVFLYRRVQMVFQDPYSSLNPRMRVTDMLQEIYRHLLKGDKSRYQDWAEELLSRVGLNRRHLSYYPFQLSGGQRQRVAIARALSLQPRLLILDEAVSALDVSVQAQILQLLMDLKNQLQLTFLFISHDLGVVRSIADRIGIILNGYLLEEAREQVFFETPVHPYSQELISVATEVIPKLEPLSDNGFPPQDICPFRNRCRRAIAVCDHQLPRIQHIRPEHRVACHLAGDSPIQS